MARRYFVNPLPTSGTAVLSRGQGHHLGRIVRTQPGDEVVLFDGIGAERHAVIVEIRGREVTVELGADVDPPRGRIPRLRLDVACAFPRRADWLLEHGTEAGIHTFRPILTERQNRRPERPEHWRKIVAASCAQCERLVLPEITAAVTLTELCAQPGPNARFVATQAARELGPTDAEHALLVVGPEGGLTDAELEQLLAAGFAPRSLGPLTLRSETAVIAGATRLLQAHA